MGDDLGALVDDRLDLQDGGGGEDLEGFRLGHHQAAAVHELHQLAHGPAGDNGWHLDGRVAQEQFVVEEGAAGGQDAAVGAQGGLADAHGDVAEVAAQALPVEGLQQRAAEVLQVDVVHRLRHGRRGQ